MRPSGRTAVMLVAVVGIAAAFQAPTSANHRWGLYHWARTASPLVLNIGDNVSTAWDTYLDEASFDWSHGSPDVLDAVVVDGSVANPKNCRPTSGRVEVCNASYGNNGWLGIAQIWASGQHITQGVVKMNDTYFTKWSPYNGSEGPGWRQLVVCQEIGHTFGLDHQDETFNNGNLGTCMDYTNSPYGPPDNLHPNQHDFDELSIIYSHFDSSTTVKPSPAFGGAQVESPAEWGQLMKSSRGGRTQVFERDFGNGQKIVTFVIWA